MRDNSKIIVRKPDIIAAAEFGRSFSVGDLPVDARRSTLDADRGRCLICEGKRPPESLVTCQVRLGDDSSPNQSPKKSEPADSARSAGL